MLGKRSPQRELFRPDNSLLTHVGADSFYGFLAKEGPRIFRDRDFADMYDERGRPGVPPSQLCILLLLQSKEGVSDEEAVQRTAFDLRWKVALGVEIEDKLCAKSTLQLFRAKLLLNERYLRLFETSVSACRKRGLGRSKNLEVAIDTTPVLGRGAVRDTYNLVSDAIRLVVRESCLLKKWDLDQTITGQGLGRHFGSSFKGECELDWSLEEERRALLAQLVADARITLELAKKALRGHSNDSPESAELRRTKGLLEDLLVQDIDEDPDDEGGPKIRKGTSRDRIVSTTDPEMRHGHKSHSKGFEGYKASVVAETKDGVILATDVRAANVADREGAADLVKTSAQVARAKVKTVLGDTAYGDVDTRRSFEALHVDVVAKAPPLQSKKGTFKRSAFKFDDRAGVATCPAGKKTIRRSPVKILGGWTYSFSRNDCTPCPLREQCTTARVAARTLTMTEHSKELDKHRRAQKTKKFRHRYRRRIKVEHAIGRLRQLGAGQAKYFGQAKIAMQVSFAAMAANIGLAALCRYFGCDTANLHAWLISRIRAGGADRTATGADHRPIQTALSRPAL